jgi:hypothetical protein
MSFNVKGAALLLLGGILGVCGAASSQAPEEGWQAGVASADITPAEPMWLAGYASRDHPSEGMVHPLWVKALALQDADGRRAVLVTSDILGFPKALSDRICDRLRSGLGLERADILLNSSHTHSSPVVAGSLMCMYPLDANGLRRVEEYAKTLEDAVVRVAEQAFADLKPARLFSGNGVARFAVNRRNNREAEILDTYEFKGPVDHAVPVLLVRGEDDAPRAVVCGYACHGTVLSDFVWCGDYPGFAQIELEKAYPGAVALFMAGCGADQNPLPRRSVALARQYGRELAAAAERAIEDSLKPLDPHLVTRYGETELALMPPLTREELEKIAIEGVSYMQNTAKDFLRQLDAGQALRSTYPYCLQVWRLGGQTLVALGGEVVVDYALSVKRMLGRDTFVLGYSNDLMSYIPSARVLKEGGYEGDTSQFLYGMPAKWQEDIESRILNAVRLLATDAGLTPTAE